MTRTNARTTKFAAALVEPDAHTSTDPRQLDIEGDRPSEPPPSPAATAARARLLELDSVPEEILSLADIRESPYNPRKRFTGIEELAASIRVHGLLQSILVRRLPEGRDAAYEVVFGARRFRAAQLAGLEVIRARVVDIDENAAAELRVTENNQREDLHPLEEAEGFVHLLADGHTTGSLAEMLGRDLSYVQKRLRLLELEPECREAFLGDRMPFGVALVIARVPYRAGQLEALKALVPPAADESRPDRDDSETVATTRAAQAWVRHNLMLRLADAQFPVTDAELVPDVGACTRCPKNTSQSPALFAEAVSDDALCTDPECWRSKNDAVFAQRAAEAEAEGVRVLSREEAAEAFAGGWGGGTGYRSSLVALSQHPGTVGAHAVKAETLGEALREHDVPRVLAQHPETKALVELVPRDAAHKALVKRPDTSATDVAAKAKDREASKVAKAKAEAAHAARMGVVFTTIAKKPPTFAKLSQLMVEYVDADMMFDVLEAALGVKSEASANETDAQRRDRWIAATKTCSEGQFAAAVVASLCAPYGHQLDHLERLWPGISRAAKDAAAAAEKGAAKALRARSDASRAGGKAAAKAKAKPAGKPAKTAKASPKRAKGGAR